MTTSIQAQKGFTLTSVIFVGAILFFVAVLGMKVGPSVSEYYTILKNIKATAHDPLLQGGSVQQIRLAYSKRSDIDRTESITEEDLDITKEGNTIVISFSYPKKIPLFANVSLLIEYEGNSSGTSAPAQ